MQKTLTFIQTHPIGSQQVFPLLCPVREKDWLDGWDFTMIHSVSGLVEEGCVFSTKQGQENTYWEVTRYNTHDKNVEFVRFTPEKNIVHIRITISSTGNNKSQSAISYTFIPLTENEENIIDNSLEQEFIQNMNWWEKSINHFLITWGKLIK